jgi:hypothetical protein
MSNPGQFRINDTPRKMKALACIAVICGLLILILGVITKVWVAAIIGAALIGTIAIFYPIAKRNGQYSPH